MFFFFFQRGFYVDRNMSFPFISANQKKKGSRSDSNGDVFIRFFPFLPSVLLLLRFQSAEIRERGWTSARLQGKGEGFLLSRGNGAERVRQGGSIVNTTVDQRYWIRNRHRNRRARRSSPDSGDRAEAPPPKTRRTSRFASAAKPVRESRSRGNVEAKVIKWHGENELHPTQVSC